MEIYVGRLSGDQRSFDKVVQITEAPGYDGGPFFSPDGKRLVYRSDRQDNHLLQIFVRELEFDAEGNITGGGSETQTSDALRTNIANGPERAPVKMPSESPTTEAVSSDAITRRSLIAAARATSGTTGRL